jgi:hypothetical protein
MQFMRNNVQDAAEQIMKFRTHRDPHVRKMVVTLIPTLAMYDTQTFTEHHLHRSMAHLLAQLEKPTERSVGKQLLSWCSTFSEREVGLQQRSLPLDMWRLLLAVR